MGNIKKIEIDKLGRSEIHYASSEGKVEKVNELISNGIDVNLVDKKGWSPLHFAAQSQNTLIAQILIEAGALIDLCDENGNSPLFKAVINYRNDGSTIELLRMYGANPYLENYFGQTPIGLARIISNYDVAKFFADLL